MAIVKTQLEQGRNADVPHRVRELNWNRNQPDKLVRWPRLELDGELIFAEKSLEAPVNDQTWSTELERVEFVLVTRLAKGLLVRERPFLRKLVQ